MDSLEPMGDDHKKPVDSNGLVKGFHKHTSDQLNSAVRPKYEISIQSPDFRLAVALHYV